MNKTITTILIALCLAITATTNAGPLRGAKGCLFEGGIRAPSVASYPAVFPQGQTRQPLVTGCDWFPTIATIQIFAVPQFVSAEETFKWNTEEGWKGERIDLPASFAKDMHVKGVEEIRFAPGMFKPDSPGFFSYVFVFAVEGKSTFTDEVVEQELMTYYKGLCKAVMRKPDLDVSGFKLAMTKDKKAGKGPATAANIVQYSAKLDWIEPFATKTSQQLNFEIQSYSIPGSDNSFLFVAASPSNTDTEIWTKMRAVRAAIEHNPK